MLYLMLVVVFSTLKKKWWFFLLLGWSEHLLGCYHLRNSQSPTLVPPLLFVVTGLAVRSDYYVVRSKSDKAIS